MKTIGLIGGMSWESTALYYRLINQKVREQLGGLHSARLVLYSVDFDPMERLQAAGRWDEAGRQLSEAACALAASGAECLVLCTNTMHRVAPAIESATTLPLLHIADATAEVIHGAGLKRVGLLGTRFTMEQAFYRERLQSRHNIEVLVPPASDREIVHRVIYEELCQGEVRPDSRQSYERVMSNLTAKGAQAVILGCTEITLLVDQSSASVPLLDTTAIHAQSAVSYALATNRHKRRRK